jgi:membrane-associated protease RseP (regulator of RpoE activity)
MHRLLLLSLLVALPGLVRAHDCPSFWEPLAQMWSEPGPEGGRLGVEIQALTPQLRDYFEVEGEAGVLVAGVEPDSPAARAGIRAGDVILEADGREVRSPRELKRIVLRFPAEEKLAIALSRGGEEKRLSLELRPRPAQLGATARLAPWMPGHEELQERMRELERRIEELEAQRD